MLDKDIISARKKVGDLIIKVLTRSLSVKNALLLFPKGFTDASLKCAWHAICHFEADEDIRKNDLFYKEEQDNYLEMLSNILIQGEPIPQDILADYKDYYKDANVPIDKGLKGFFQSILRFLNVK